MMMQPQQPQMVAVGMPMAHDHASSKGHRDDGAHEAFDPEPIQTLPDGEPHTPGWLPIVGAGLFAIALVWWMAGSAGEPGTTPAASAAPSASAAPPGPSAAPERQPRALRPGVSATGRDRGRLPPELRQRGRPAPEGEEPRRRPEPSP
jgi:hypothetical protein